MKKAMQQLFQILIVAVVIWGCEKDENRNYFEGGNAPVLTTSADTVALSAAMKDKEAMRLSWTNPNYRFTTGVSSQNVSYTIQVDTAGANFSSSVRQEVNVSRDLSYSLTVDALNKLLTKMNLSADTAHRIEVRVAANLNGAVPLYSNAVPYRVVPYEDFALPPPLTDELYITGDATPSGWTNEPPAAQKVTRDNKGFYHIDIDLVSGKYYKFLSNLKQWQPQYGAPKPAAGGTVGAESGNLAVNMGNGSDPEAIPAPAVSGKYHIELDFRTGKYTVTKI